MTTYRRHSVRKESNRDPIFSWIAHHLRLLGQVSAAQAAKAFGVNTRQFRRWIDQYNEQAALKGNPEAISLRGPRNAPAFRASSLTSEQIEDAGKQARGVGEVFPVVSGLIPSTSEALSLLDAWRAHAILAHVSPNAYEDPTFLDGDGDPIVVETGGAIHPRLDGEIIPVLLQALTMKRPITLDYINKKGRRERRVFSPHRFIFSQGRYHVRGYDHLRKRCLDLNPARAFSAQIQPSDAPYLGPDLDTEWSQTVKLSFAPTRRAINNQHHMATIRQTFPIRENGVLEVKVRKPLAYYVRIQILNYALRTDDGITFPAFYERS